MMTNEANSKGFTLIELVIIILVLGILAATAIPKFFDLSAKARQAAEKGVVGGVRGGIAIAYTSNLVNGSTTFPASLGGTAPGTASAVNPFFGNVLAPGVTDGTWTLSGAVYTGPGGGTYQYSAVSGTFQ
jgi:MSHA pilin protein MshA